MGRQSKDTFKNTHWGKAEINATFATLWSISLGQYLLFSHLANSDPLGTLKHLSRKVQCCLVGAVGRVGVGLQEVFWQVWAVIDQQTTDATLWTRLAHLNAKCKTQIQIPINHKCTFPPNDSKC